MIPILRSLALLGALLAGPALGADLHGAPPATGRFLATCEDLGQLCFADACGRNQIDAALTCRAACPSSVTLRVEPARCPLPEGKVTVVLRRKG
ncbi:hypothetical protein [Methylobacterium organophilum]|uniref:Uncharacterized protein n=1 Tax=Methylobacterium organophilum TaxID=410 RepID=A0ABQ4T9N0_METOR|nr:hypothetical protein [Methylobacterium organophilum]GJE28377.1 hypothetical protein LKMONMHP_3248 [Methylobacterium organophilum]